MNNIPNHVAIIMDGNGRWGKKKGKDRSYGHKYGAMMLERLSNHALKRGIKCLSVYAFSTDNFKRSSEEVNFIMDLLVDYFNKKLNKLEKEGVKVLISGRRENLRKDVIDAIENVQDRTKNNDKCILNICLNYGGQEEIVDSVNKLIENNDEATKENLYKYMYNELDDIDLLIRTGGEKRLSNFMLYLLSYAEIYFVDTYFPDFDENEFDKAIDFYIQRDRRFGDVK